MPQANATMKAARKPARRKKKAGRKKKATRKKAVRRKVKSALAEGPVTVPAVALAAEIETDTALWHITAMKKYGLAVEDGMDGDWPLYRLPEPTEDKA